MEDQEFHSSFQLVAERNGNCIGFISYFDIDFLGVQFNLSFSTGPHAKSTHWKQVKISFFFNSK